MSHRLGDEAALRQHLDEVPVRVLLTVKPRCSRDMMISKFLSCSGTLKNARPLMPPELGVLVNSHPSSANLFVHSRRLDGVNAASQS